MSSLPEDIVTDLLSKLPAKSISRFRCVCKPWYELFKNPNFIKRHLHHAIQNNKFSVLLASYEDPYYGYKHAFYTIDFDVSSSSYHMVVECLPRDMYVPNTLRIDSCHGLICLATNQLNAYGKICLWNPLTRECKKISKPCHQFSRCGIYYDWKIDDYKLFILQTNFQCNDLNLCKVWVSRLGSNSWKCIGSMPYNEFCYNKICVTPLNGVIHWIKENIKVIFSFDMVKVQTKKIQMPNCYADYELYNTCEHMEVGVLGEELYLSVNVTKHMDLWVMKDYGVMDSWTKILSLSTDETKFVFLWPLHYLNKNWEILLHGYVYVEGEGSCKDVLVSYDTKSGRLVTLDIPCLPKYFSPTTLVESLISPNA